MIDDELRRLLLDIVQRIDGQGQRFDAIAAKLDRMSNVVSSHTDPLRALTDGVAIVASLQAGMSTSLGNLDASLARMVEGSVLGRTHDAERYAALDARVGELERQVRALSASPGR